MAADGKMAAAATFLVFLLLANASADISKCNQGCFGSAKQDQGYLPGTAYTYDFEGLAKVQLSSADHQETSVKISAKAVITNLGNCAHLLKITTIDISTPDGTKYPKPRNINKAVRFVLQDGVLGSDICIENDDNQASVNIKRAILSMLQTANKHNTEVDIFGVCPTSFKTRKESGNVVITKYRDLNACAHREQGKNDLIAAIYNPNAEIKSTNILDSNLRVETSMKNGIVQRSDAMEDYIYVPFSSGSSGAKAQVVTKIVLKETKAGFNIQANCVVPKSIIFENPHLDSEYSNTDNIQLALKTASQSMDNNVDSKSASIFVNLVRVLRSSSKNDIQNVYNQIKGGSTVQNNKFVRRVFLDALFRAGTGESIEVAIDLVLNKELSPLEQRLALISLATARHATSSSIKSAMKLLDVPDLSDNVYLGVGSLAGAYCRDHNCHGATSRDANIAALSNKLASKLGNCKPNDKKSETTIIYALKGIKNIHHLEDSIVSKLVVCASDKNVKPRIRVAALETFGADPCIKQLKSAALSILKDRQQDSEIRIKAYLALLDCPCANVAGELKKMLDDEPVYQVGSFISSSLKNIRSSTNPSRKAAKDHFGIIHPKKTYPFDVRKYSQNFELSYEYEMLGIGSNVDANVIYSQDSFMPRSANLNLTTELFGRNINLIELGYRQGNLDRIVEEYFGPHGTINTHTPQEIYKGVEKTTSNIFDRIQKRLKESRGKRSVLQQTKNFAQQLKHEINGFNGNLDLDIFLKMFGSEIVFLSLGDDKPVTFESLIDKFFDAMDSGISDANHFTHEIRNHMILLDSELAFPTSTGFSLKLNAEAAATTKIQFSGNVDIRQIMNDPKNCKIDIKFVPSANIEATGTLLIDADVVASGLKVISSLHTSTGSHIVTKLLDNGQGFDMQIGLPVDKQELITANHEIMYITRPKSKQEIKKDIKFDISNRYQFNGCFDQLSSAIGLTLCSDISVPWNPVNDPKNNQKSLTTLAKGPLSGPSKISIRLEKEDLNGFHITGMYKTIKETQKILDITVEANGSEKTRKVTFVADVINREDRRSIKISLTSPVKTANLEAEAAMINSNSEKSLMARAALGKSEYMGKIGMMLTGSQAKVTITPILQFKTPSDGNKDANMMQLTGSITKTQSGKSTKYTANNICLIMPSKAKLVEVTGFFQYEGSNGQIDLNLSFDNNNNKNKKATITGRYKIQENSYNSQWDFKHTMYPNLDFHIDINSALANDVKTFDFTFMYGEDQKVNKIKYTSKTKTLHMDDLSAIDFYFENSFEYPLWDVKFETETEMKPKKFKSKVEAAYTNAYKTKFLLDLQKDMKTVNDFHGKINLNVNENGFGSEIRFDVTGQDKGNYDFKFNSRPGESYHASGTVNYHLATDDTNVGFTVNLKNLDKGDDIIFEIGLVENQKIYNSHCKIARGKKNYVDFILKINQEPAPSGSLKLFFNDLVKCDGQFKVNAQDKKGNGALIVTFIKSNKKMMIETNFLMSKPNFNANVDIYYDHEKDNSKKITIITSNMVTDENVDSKVSLINGNDKIDFTLKAEVILTGGAFYSGKQNIMTTLSHSNGPSISWKFDRKMENDNEIVGQVDSQLTYVPVKSGKPHKLNFQVKVQNQNKEDLEYHLTYLKPSGEDLDLKLCFKRAKNDDRTVYENQIEFNGALVPNAISYYGSFDMNSDENEDASDLKYRIKSSYGSQTTLDASGKLSYDIREGFDKSYCNEIDATIVLPFENAHNVKFKSNDLFKISKDDNNDVQLTSDFLVQVNTNTYKYQINLAGSDDKGQGLLMVQVPNHNQFLTKMSYSQNEDGKKINQDGQWSVEYGENQKLSIGMVGHHVPRENGNFVFDIKLPSNFKSAQQIKYNVEYKATGSDAIVLDLGADIDGKKHTVYCNVDFLNPNTPVIEIKGTCPDKKPYRFYIKANALDIKSVKGEAKIENFGKFNLDMNVEAMLQSADEFRWKVNIDCEQLNLKKIQFEAFNEGESKGVKKIQFSAKENNKNVLSGSTTYESRKEGEKFIMEGAGSFKLRDKQKSTNFKYIRNKIAESDEKGTEVFFNVALGEKNTAIQYKLTNKNYKLSTAYCEEKKQCSNIDIINKLDSGENKLLHNLEISADLRKLANIPEFGLKTFTEWEKYKLPVHMFDIYFTLDKFKYFTQSYAKPIDGNYLTAFTVNLPQRVLSLESTTTHSSSLPFPFCHEVVLYPNKNAPQSKSMYKINVDFQREPHKYNKLIGDMIVSSPALSKDLIISGNSMYDVSTHGVSAEMTFDVFKTKNHAILVSYNFGPVINEQQISAKSLFQIKINEPVVLIKFDEDLHISHDKYVPNNFKLKSAYSWTIDPAHKGPNKKEIVFSILINKEQQKMELTSPGINFLKYASNVKYNKDVLCEVTGTVSVFQKEPVAFNAEIKTNPHYSFKFSSGTSARKFILSGMLAPSKNTEVKAEFIEGKQQKNLVSVAMKMENKSYKPDVRVNDANIKEYVTAVTNDLRDFAKTSIEENKKFNHQTSADIKVLLNVVKGNFMDLNMINEKIKTEVKKINSELDNDKALQEYMKSTNEIIKSTVATVGEVISQIAGAVQETMKFVSTMFDNTVKLVNEKILPELTKLYGEISKVCSVIVDNVANLLTYYFTAAFDFYEKNLVHIQPLIDSLNSICKDALQIATKAIDQITNTCNELLKSISQSIKNSPFAEKINEIMEQFNVEQIFSTMVDTTSEFLCGVAPTEESIDFVRSLTNYLRAKIEKQNVDDVNELKMLVSKFEKALESLLAYIKSVFGDQNLSIDEVPQPNLIKFSNIVKLGLPSISFLNFLERERLPTFQELIMAYRPKSFSPLGLVPPFRLKGIIAGGQHIFTFDGRHITFPGSCKYVVSQDAVDGNFSIVITLDKGIAKSINVVDKSGNDVEVNLKTELLYGGSVYGFPLIKRDILAFKDSDSFTIKTQYGARVKCSFNLDMCYFEVSGFYLGKLRGLLGDGNNEPFDDFRLPNGKISTSESEFGNSYSLTGGCAQVKTVDHSHHHGHNDGHRSSGICNKIFSKSSDFSLCYFALNPDNYRQACEHATHGLPEDKAKTEGCLIARAYTLACNSIALPTPLPDVCSQCEVGGTTYKSDVEFDVTTPQNQADIILAVETTKDNEKVYRDLVIPLLSNVMGELKKNKIDDVKVYLVGVSPKIQYPIYYDIKNNKLQDSKIDFKDEPRSKLDESPITTDNPKVDKILNSIAVLIQKARVELGLNAIHLTYANLGKLQLRPKAVNTVLMVHSEPCTTAIFPLVQKLGSAISENILKDRGTVVHLISPLDLNVNGKQNSQVVGFNEDYVFLSDDKKRGLSHANLRSSLKYDDKDACMSHALESFGNVYSSKNFLSCGNNQKKSFISMMSQTIVDSLVKVTLESECECERDIFTLKDKLNCSVKRRSDKRKPGSKK